MWYHYRDCCTRKATLKSYTPDYRTLARAALIGVATVMVAAWFAKPGEATWLPSCPIYKYTGLFCPGCGTTRMLYYLAHGRFIEALRYNALTLLVLPILLYSLIRKSLAFRLPALPQLSSRGITALTIFIIFFTVARNIPAEPFCELAPGAVCRTNVGMNPDSRQTEMRLDEAGCHLCLRAWRIFVSTRDRPIRGRL